jgi:hypothetical protein
MKLNIEERVLHFKQPAGTSRGVYTTRRIWLITAMDEEGRVTGIGECAPLPQLSCDDIPDYEVMLAAGCPCCPRDACSDIKAISVYVSNMDGGQGCGRDIIEQVLRAQGKWLSNAKAFGW